MYPFYFIPFLVSYNATAQPVQLPQQGRNSHSEKDRPGTRILIRQFFAVAAHHLSLPLTPSSAMTDLTVLISPTPYLPAARGLFSKKSAFTTPIMVTLEREQELSESPDGSRSPTPEFDASGQYATRDPPVRESRARRSREPRVKDHGLLSPPVNTWKAPRPRHRPQRSQSAPPERRSPPVQAIEGLEGRKSPERQQVHPQDFAIRPRMRTATTYPSGMITSRGGELARPPPPLCTSPPTSPFCWSDTS